MPSDSPVLVWHRRDLRLGDHAALSQASATGRPVLPVFIHDEVVSELGAAPRYRLGLGLAEFSRNLEGIGSRLILRRGPAIDVLRKLIAETGAGAVLWQRAYDPPSTRRDDALKPALESLGVEVRVLPGHVLFDPQAIVTRNGGPYSVFTPFWKTVRNLDPGSPLPAVKELRPCPVWPSGDLLDDWNMGKEMGRGRAVVSRHVVVGEAAARDRLMRFAASGLGDYGHQRDVPGVGGTSRLSEHLALGEISARTVWAVVMAARDAGEGGEDFLRELVWREFAYNLMYHTPHIAEANWRVAWNGFPWNEDERAEEVLAWQRGRTGVRFVDAAMRELMVTGYMHNRARMIVAGYLTKHLMTHWLVGLRWFEEHLIDWDPASNALGWQWSAGSGPDAVPYFRIMNPERQLDRFDADRVYVRRWIAEGQAEPDKAALEYFEAIPRSWGMAPTDRYPLPIISVGEGRARALEAYSAMRS